MITRRTLKLALAGLVLSACENGRGDIATTSTSELSNGVQVLCQSGGGCDAHTAAVKIMNTNNGRTLSGSFCSGTVIGTVGGPPRVLTSAKCLMDNNFNPRKLCITNRIGAGTPAGRGARCDVDAPVSELYYVRNAFVHPSYTGVVGSGFDAAVVELERPLMPFDDALGTIPPLPIDDQVFTTGTQGTDFGFGTNASDSSVSGQKQVRSDIPSVASSFPNYIAVAPASTTLLTGDFGGGFIRGFNQVTGINSFVQNGNSFMTRTTPIRTWINAPASGSLPTCNVSGYKRIQSDVTGTCLEANGTAVTLKFCECKNSQLWLTGSNGSFTNRATNTVLTAQAEGGSPITTPGPATSPSQLWLIISGTRRFQLTANSGPTLVANTMNSAAMGATTSPMKLWDLN